MLENARRTSTLLAALTGVPACTMTTGQSTQQTRIRLKYLNAACFELLRVSLVMVVLRSLRREHFTFPGYWSLCGRPRLRMWQLSPALINKDLKMLAVPFSV